MSGHTTMSHIISADLVTAGTIAPTYPSGKTKSDFVLGRRHKIIAQQTLFESPRDFELAPGATTFTITWRHAATIPSGESIRIQIDEAGDDSGDPVRVTEFGDLFRVRNTARLIPVLIDLGAAITADIDFFLDGATGAEVPDIETVTYTPDTDGTSPTDAAAGVVVKSGVNYWELDVPRNITTTVTHATSVVAMTILVTGLDEYGQAMSELITVAATGTSQADAGIKAFKWVRSIALIAAADAEANTVEVGFGDLLGLPIFMPSAGAIVRELEDGVTITAGATVAGSKVVASTISADVRGTYDPNSAANGSKAFQLMALLPDPDYIGGPQA